jgi:hypothetical protein
MKVEVFMMNQDKSPNQRIRLIALKEMEPESGYQRNTNPAQVENIVKKFDESKLGILTVSQRGGKYHIIDGAHRSKALRRLGYTHANCVVLTGLTFDQEAEYFRKQNQDRRLIKPLEFFRAGLVSGDAHCVNIYRILRANGFDIGTGGKDFHVIAAIQTLFIVSEEYGYHTLDDTLRLIAGTWNGIRRASQAEALLGVAEFVHRYGAVDFEARMKDKFYTVFHDYADTTRARASNLTARRIFCRALVKQYNRGLGGNSKKRLVWEDAA